jgi:two-component system OmpR family sensor kinase
VRLHKFESRKRLIIRVGLAMVLVLSLAAWLSAEAVERELSRDIDDNLRAEAASIVSVLDVIDYDMLEEMAAAFSVGDRDWALILISPDGSEVTSPAGAADDRDPLPDVLDTPVSELRGRAGEPFTVDDVEGGDDAYRVLTVALEGGGVAVTAQSFDSVNAVLRIIHKVFVVGTVLGLLALGALVWIITRHALKPLEDVVETAHRIGAGNLNTRVDVRSTAPDVARLADALNAMLSRLQTSFDQKERTEARLRQFVSDASHELRTPLAAIIGYAELYEQQMARSPEQIDTAMRGIATESARMQTLVEDLLLLARLEEGRRLARDAVDLVSLVGDAVRAMRMIDDDHTIELVPPAESIDVVGDGLAIRQVVDNLLSNVVTHTPAGTTATLTVTTATRQVDGHDQAGATIVVSDDGPGMNAEQAAKAFDRFYRAEQARSRPGGSGLGLAIVDELVRAHDGTIDLVTAPGEGTTFTIWLPLAAAPATAATAASPGATVAADDARPSPPATVAATTGVSERDSRG